MTDLIGKTILGRYRVDASIGRGGMAEVYKVWDTHRSTYLAMKLLHADLAQDPIFLRRFRCEAQNLFNLQHPNIVRLYGLEQDDLVAFMLMDFVESTTLRAEILRLKGKTMPSERIREVMQPTCAALHYAHRQKIVHCDIKPANVMIEKNGHILLADFGIARMAEGATTMTMVGAGTPAYMAPEQLSGENPSPQTDIYALGIMLYEMLTGGERPFTGEQARITGTTSEKVRWEHMNLTPPSPRKFNRKIPAHIESVVMKCLEKEPSKRFADATEVVDAIMQEETGGVETPVEAPPPVPEPVPVSPSPITKEAAPPPVPVVAKPVTKIEAPAPVPSPVPTRGTLRTMIEQLPKTMQRRPPAILITILVGAALLALLVGTILSSRTTDSTPAAAPVGIQEPGFYFTSNANGHAEIYMNKEGQITRYTDPAVKANNWSPVVSKSGILYFVSDRSGKSEIWLLNHGKSEQVTTAKGPWEDWSPVVSNAGLLYFASDRSGKAELWLLDAQGRSMQVTKTEDPWQSCSPEISSSGLVYFVSDRIGKSEIWLMDNQGKTKQVTKTEGSWKSWSPTFSTSGQLYFVSDRSGHAEIYRLWNNGQVERFTDSGKGECWSPLVIGSNIYFTSIRNEKMGIYLLKDQHSSLVVNMRESWIKKSL